MAMNIGPAEGGEDEAISTINTTPLVDVMLVLLIIFLVTIPVITQSIALKLPEETNVPRQTKPENSSLVTRTATSQGCSRCATTTSGGT
jgi:biopolymer transport protein ExbD